MANKRLYTILRILTGLVFLVFGGIKFFPATQQPLPGIAGAFIAGLAASGYFIIFLGIMEVIIGAMLLFNKWPALASIMLVPISLNIFLFDVILRPDGFFVGVFPLLFNAYFIYYHWDKYLPMIRK